MAPAHILKASFLLHSGSISLILHMKTNSLKYFISFCFILGEEAGTEEYNYGEHSILKWLILPPCLYSHAPFPWAAINSS